MNNFFQPKILIVDDDEVLCELLSEQLREEKLNTDMAFRGKEALRKIKSEDYNLIILNFNMPGMTGDDVLSQIKNYDASIPVFMLTTRDDPASIVKCMKLGAEDYFTKPYDYEEILDAVIKYFK